MQPCVCGPADTDGTRSSFPDPANRKNSVWGRKRVATRSAGTGASRESCRNGDLFLHSPTVPTTDGTPHAPSHASPHASPHAASVNGRVRLPQGLGSRKAVCRVVSRVVSVPRGLGNAADGDGRSASAHIETNDTRCVVASLRRCVRHVVVSLCPCAPVSVRREAADRSSSQIHLPIVFGRSRARIDSASFPTGHTGRLAVDLASPCNITDAPCPPTPPGQEFARR